MTLSEEFKVNDLSEELNWYIVCRLGFNPTKKNEEYKTKLKTVA